MHMLNAYATWQAEDNHVIVYNSLFDMAIHLVLQNGCNGAEFMMLLERGTKNILQEIACRFSQPAEEIYRLLVHKKIIE